MQTKNYFVFRITEFVTGSFRQDPVGQERDSYKARIVCSHQRLIALLPYGARVRKTGSPATPPKVVKLV